MSTKKTLLITLKFSSEEGSGRFWHGEDTKTYRKGGSLTYKQPKQTGGLHTVTIRFNNKTELLSTDELGKMRKACKAKFIDQKIES